MLDLVDAWYNLALIFVVVVVVSYDVCLKRRVEYWGLGSSTLLYQDQYTFYSI